MHKQALSITILAAALCGCGPMPPMAPMDATVIRTMSGAAVTKRDDVPVTARNWNCMGCYK